MGAWRERYFRLLFIGQAVSAFGSTLVPVALAFAVLNLTGSARDLGDVLGAQAAAVVVVFLLIGGVVADRAPRCLSLALGSSIRPSCRQQIAAEASGQVRDSTRSALAAALCG